MRTTRVEHGLVMACRTVLQTVNGGNPAATKIAHEEALADLKKALNEFLKEKGEAHD